MNSASLNSINSTVSEIFSQRISPGGILNTSGDTNSIIEPGSACLHFVINITIKYKYISWSVVQFPQFKCISSNFVVLSNVFILPWNRNKLFITITRTGNTFYSIVACSLHNNTSLGITLSRDSVYVQFSYLHMSDSHI